ncbi:MAG: sigma-70 family RNA polymerase sigma factor [Lachnoclostridium sp.]|nr:sigma-70 family RNA polymerase sigma factor [Lachnospira sp.]MCM1248261.1 sigma-70 family RNA polymerase sigma factor [Lachnoclostridium sp.]MCM1535210.1 sigma-70 family RNA polymerase sigma factor [Clostridium sp.]
METLIKKAKLGDADAFTELMTSQMPGMYRIARAVLLNDEDAADAISDTILTCFEKLGTLRENRYFKTWMTRILMNKCYEIIRANKHMVYVEELPEQALEGDMSDLEWKEAMNALDKKYRIVLILYYAQGFHTKEIAKILKIPDSTVRTRLSRGREQLAKYLESV